MSSVLWRIEIYEGGSFGCPEFNLMGYGNIIDLLEDCHEHYVKLGKQVVPHDKCEEQYCGELTHGGDIYKCRKCVKTADGE